MADRHPSWNRADEVLHLVRLNTPEALRLAEAILGKPITRCPPCIPPWPPLPVRKASRVASKVSWKSSSNPHSPSSDAFARFNQVRVGMTTERLLLRGILHRDIRLWKKIGVIKFS